MCTVFVCLSNLGVCQLHLEELIREEEEVEFGGFVKVLTSHETFKYDDLSWPN